MVTKIIELSVNESDPHRMCAEALLPFWQRRQLNLPIPRRAAEP
jgi:hypothetical protein